ncbi:unnamed protein product [Eruca vesicaria subsp. sativa]|uniref:Uncharacterized protein n=1 Tax=Eruca vesicaria subsp. sativa TaxID=29727 RepID=A0ABC8JBP2_ERUVS|nr:unnamed protein product [Eruca vesicaria subsp. sativa]
MELVQRQGKRQPDSRASSLRYEREEMETERRRRRRAGDSKREKTEDQVVWMDKVGEELSIGVCDVSEVKEVKHKVEEEDKHGDDYSTLYILAYFFTRKRSLNLYVSRFGFDNVGVGRATGYRSDNKDDVEIKYRMMKRKCRNSWNLDQWWSETKMILHSHAKVKKQKWEFKVLI